MEDRRLGTRVCVLCGTDGADADAPDEEVPADAAARTEELGRPQQRGTVQAAERDVSELLAEKMLAGWALLGQACPMCGTTLVRNKQQQMLCVSCDKFVVIQSSADQARSAAEERSSPAVARPSHAAPVEASRGRTGAGAPRPQGPSQGRQSQSVRDIVWRKAEETAAELSATPASKTEECMRLLALIRDCQQTLQVLSEVPDQHR